MNPRIVLLIIGGLLGVLALCMCFPAMVDGSQNNPDWKVFMISAGVTAVVAGTLLFGNLGIEPSFTTRDGFVMTCLAWVILPAFASMPFMFSEANMTFTDAYFEAMSGLTTTGSTVIVGLNELAPGLLLWRGILQWIGGIGIVVMAISVLPLMRVGGMQLFKVEAFDVSSSDRSGAIAIAAIISAIYLGMTVLCGAALYGAGMKPLEATVHAMTTIATGGFSTSDSSVGHFDSASIDVIITFGMIAGGIPFLLYAKALRGDLGAIFRDSQVQGYLALLFAAIMSVTAWLVFLKEFSTEYALRKAAFTVTSIMTGTGYTSGDFSLWGTFPVGLLFFLMFVGGCAGSTACGMKVFRFQILFSASHTILRRMIYPSGVFVPHYNKKAISEDIVSSVMGFVFLFAITYGLLAIALMGAGLDLVTALSSAATAISNVGPGLGPIVGPAGTFHDIDSTAKWLLSAGMLIGRLEVYSVYVIFLPIFWRR
ncbi:MAG: TrkH family potassium uptake protein [Alphaproteobacteria bacterium]|nr:MAG: TrkH family potassium uptake protein [Alphaproteobacteria bacterium]